MSNSKKGQLVRHAGRQNDQRSANPFHFRVALDTVEEKVGFHIPNIHFQPNVEAEGKILRAMLEARDRLKKRGVESSLSLILEDTWVQRRIVEFVASKKFDRSPVVNVPLPNGCAVQEFLTDFFTNLANYLPESMRGIEVPRFAEVNFCGLENWEKQRHAPSQLPNLSEAPAKTEKA